MHPVLTMLLSPYFYQYALLAGLLLASLGRVVFQEPLRRPPFPFVFAFCALAIAAALPWQGAETMAQLFTQSPQTLFADCLAVLRTHLPNSLGVLLYILLVGCPAGLPVTAATMVAMTAIHQTICYEEMEETEELPEERNFLVATVTLFKLLLCAALYVWLVVGLYRTSVFVSPGRHAALVCRLLAVAPALLFLVFLSRRHSEWREYWYWMLLQGFAASVGLFVTGNLYFPLLIGASLLPAWGVRAIWGPQWAWENIPSWWDELPPRQQYRVTRMMVLPDIADEAIPEIMQHQPGRVFRLTEGFVLRQRGHFVEITTPYRVFRRYTGIADAILDVYALGPDQLACFTAAGELMVFMPQSALDEPAIRYAILPGSRRAYRDAAIGDSLGDILAVTEDAVYHLLPWFELDIRLILPNGVIPEEVAYLPGRSTYLLRDRDGGIWFQHGREATLHKAKFR